MYMTLEFGVGDFRSHVLPPIVVVLLRIIVLEFPVLRVQLAVRHGGCYIMWCLACLIDWNVFMQLDGVDETSGRV